jgi:hypothetical protein
MKIMKKELANNKNDDVCKIETKRSEKLQYDSKENKRTKEQYSNMAVGYKLQRIKVIIFTVPFGWMIRCGCVGRHP